MPKHIIKREIPGVGSPCHCVFLASNEEILCKHAEKIGSPIISTTKVENVRAPTTADG